MFVFGNFTARLLSLNKPPFSEVFMLVSWVFCRSVASYQKITVVSFAEIGRLLRQDCSDNRPSLLKKSTDEFLRMRIIMFCCQITTNWSHINEFSDVFLPRKALQ